jgi:hypothetical protein
MLSVGKSKSVSKFSILAATILSLGFASTRSFAGDGRNGPHLAGIAVPPRADRSFNPDDLVKATLVCTNQQVKAFYEQYFKRSWDMKYNVPKDASWDLPPTTKAYIANDNYAREVDVDGKPKHLHTGYFTSLINPQGSTIKYSTDIENFNRDGVRLQVVIELANGDLPQVKERNPLLAIVGGVPVFVYDRAIENIKYDEYGQLISFKEALKNLKIGLPDGNGDAMPYFTIIRDGMSGTPRAPTAAKFNGVQYVNCLLGELQK